MIMIFLAAFSQVAFSQAQKSCCTPNSGKSCCSSKSGKACAGKSAAACTHDASTSSADMQSSAATGTMVKKVAVAVPATQTAQFQVWGNCGMCKKTIEKAAMSLNGITSADWNMDTHQMTVAFDASSVKIEQVHQAIAAAGYDTDQVYADNKAYDKLHTCCQYDRRPSN